MIPVYSPGLPRCALSVVVPTFNERAAIGAFIRRMTAYLDRTALDWELIVADDGSEDETTAIVEEMARTNQRVRLLRGAHRGKGAAVRRGMLEARGAWRFMADADLSMPPENIDRFLAAVRAADPPHIAIGSREAPGAHRVGEPWSRHVIGRAFNAIVQLLAVPGVRDTQCGFKLFSAEAVEAVFPHQRIDGFAFDVEVLFLARRAGFDVREVGIVWHGRRDSRVGIGKGAAAFADVIRVRANQWRGRYRGLPAAPARRAPVRLDRVCC